MGLSGYHILDSAVSLINKTNMDTVIVEIDISKSFKDVIQGLAKNITRKNVIQGVF